MSKGRHRSGQVSTSGSPLFSYILIGGSSMALGIIPLGTGLVEAFRYSPYEDPGALGTATGLLIMAAVMIGVPVAAAVIASSWTGMKAYSAWKKTLTPVQRSMLLAAEVLGLEVLHHKMHAHNREMDRKLSASVEGTGPKPGQPGW